MEPTTYSTGYRPLVALRALRQLIANPADTAQVFTIIEALSGGAPDRIMRRFRESPSGRKLLQSHSNLLTRLADRAALEALPDGTLGRAYLAFIDREGITPDGLVDASVEGELGEWRTRGDDFSYVNNRLRDTHDLWHVVTGYGGDVLGEAALLGFIAAQTTNPGMATMAFAAVLRSGDREVAKKVLAAFRAGRRAVWLVPIEWEALLAEPLDIVRARLGIVPVAPYVRLGTDWRREAA